MEQAMINVTNVDDFVADYAILCLSCGFLIIFYKQQYQGKIS